MNRKIDVVQRWYEEVWERGNWEQIDVLYQPVRAEDCLLAKQTAARVEIRELIGVLRDLIRNIRVRVVHVIEDGAWISAYVELNGYKAGTSQPVQMDWIAMMRVEGDCIVESYPSSNFLKLFEQLGQLPENTFELLLSGTVLK